MGFFDHIVENIFFMPLPEEGRCLERLSSYKEVADKCKEIISKSKKYISIMISNPIPRFFTYNELIVNELKNTKPYT